MPFTKPRRLLLEVRNNPEKFLRIIETNLGQAKLDTIEAAMLPALTVECRRASLMTARENMIALGEDALVVELDGKIAALGEV